MCGHVGIAGNLSYKDEATTKRLLLLDYFRGPDSTGLAAVTNSGETKIAKIASHPLDLFEMPRFKSALSGSNSKVFLGHNRAATRGVVNTYNAHPYQFDHITGAHNGTLDAESTKALENAIGEKFGVDSQAIFAGIAKLGVEETLKLMTEGRESTTGAWSLVWYDQNQNSLNFLRNKHRPMWYAYTKELDRIFWASEWAMIENAVRMSAHGYDLFEEDNKDKSKRFKFFSTEADIHYRYDMEVLAKGGKERPKPTARALKGKEPKAAAVTTTYSPFPRPTGLNPGSGTGPSATPTTTTTSPGKTEKPSNVIHLFGDISNPLAGLIDEETFARLANDGCSWCSTPIDYRDKGITVFERDDMVFCRTCSKDRGDASSTVFVSSMTGLC